MGNRSNYRRMKCWKVVVASLVVFGTMSRLSSTAGKAGPPSGPTDDWKAYAGSNAGLRYSPLDQIKAGNVKNLRIVWRQSVTPKAVRQGPGAPLPINYA